MNRVLPVLAIFLGLALIFFYVRPTFAGPVAETKVQIASYDAALEAAERFKQKEAELTQARAAIDPASLERLLAFLPDGVDNVQLILDLNALASRSGMTLSDFDIADGDNNGTDGDQSIDEPSPLDSVDLTVSATGSYSAFRTFLAGMETSLRPLDLVNVTVDESETGVYTYDLTIRLYWLR